MLDLWPSELAERLRALPLVSGDVVVLNVNGTLWPGSVGESLLEYAVARKALVGSPGTEAFEHYQRVRSLDEEEGLEAAALAFVGMPVEALRELSRAHYQEKFQPLLRPCIRELVGWLHETGVRVFLVAASFEHAVFPVADDLEIPRKRVVGIRLHEVEGKVTGLRLGPVPFRDGKARELHERTGVAPKLVFASGSNDLELMEAASLLAVAVNPSPQQRRDGRASLARVAAENSWPILSLGEPRGA